MDLHQDSANYINDIDNIELQPPSPSSQHIDLYYTANNSPFSSHSDLSDHIQPFPSFSEEAYDPHEFDHPGSASSLLMFDDAAAAAPFQQFDYRSPSPAHSDNDDTRSRASSTSSSHAPYQQYNANPTIPSFENLSFRSPAWSNHQLPQAQAQPKPPSPPRLVMPDQPPVLVTPDGNSNDDPNAGPRLHIVPATPISGGATAANHVNQDSYPQPLGSLRQSNFTSVVSLEPHHSQWLDVVDKSNPTSRSVSPALSSGTAPAPSRSPSASPQPFLPSLLPTVDAGDSSTDMSFLVPPVPRSRSKSDTSLEPLDWNNLLPSSQQQQPQPQPQHSPFLSTAHPPTLGSNFTFGSSSSSAQQQQATQQHRTHDTDNIEMHNFLSPDMSGFNNLGLRRSKSDTGARSGVHRASRSEDYRSGSGLLAPGPPDSSFAPGGLGLGLGGAGSSYLYQQPSQQQHQSQFLSPLIGAAGLGTNGMRVPELIRASQSQHHHSQSLSVSSTPGELGVSVSRHIRRASSGSRSERGSPATWSELAEHGATGVVFSGSGSNRVSPYPSPNASPRIRYNELRDRDQQDAYEFGNSLNVPGTATGSRVPSSAGSVTGAPLMTVSKPNVTTGRTANASQRRRKQEANFKCPVPGCGSTFTRSFNLKGHIRSHNEEKPFQCHWPGCGKGFARQHDCKRHEQLHTNYRPFVCEGCNKPFARMDALNRHLRSDGGAECLKMQESNNAAAPEGSPSITGKGGATSMSSPSSKPNSALPSSEKAHAQNYSQGHGEPPNNPNLIPMMPKMEEAWGVGLSVAL